MVILISGASHTGKTLLAGKLVRRHGWPCVSIDLVKMGLIRSGVCALTPEDDDELEAYLWPIVREMAKTAVENGQDLIIEGGYIPHAWRDDFGGRYLPHIRHRCLVMSEGYIRRHFADIKRHADAAEARKDDSWFTEAEALAENARNLELCRKHGCDVIMIDDAYEVDWDICAIAPMRTAYWPRQAASKFSR